jgi:NAD(P)-dependent dehydrogenase (short-subunit alcohol dehydrogenase family)
VKQIEKLIYPVSFYRHKAKHVKETCRILVEKFSGKVPMTMEELLTLPGVGRKTAIHRVALQATGRLGGLDVLINNASSLGPVPLAPLADTECEALEQALATNLVGPFRLTRALLGALAASAREGTGAVVLNVSSDAAVQPYPGWGAYGASKAGLRHLSDIWDQELRELGVRVLSVDPGDMDTPLHALAVPEADRGTLKDPAVAAEEVLGVIGSALAALGASHPEPFAALEGRLREGA